MNFTKEYNEAIMNFSPVVIGDIKFEKIYCANPKNLIKYINDFVIPKKEVFIDSCNILIKLFKCQVEMNPEYCIQRSSDWNCCLYAGLCI